MTNKDKHIENLEDQVFQLSQEKSVLKERVRDLQDALRIERQSNKINVKHIPGNVSFTTKDHVKDQ